MARINLSGPVVGDDLGLIYDYFGYATIYPQKVRMALEQNPDGEELVLEINSTGGQVWAGFEIYSLLRASNVHSVAEVQSVAASAASTITSGCSEVRMSPVAQIMIHDPSLCGGGNIREHKEGLQMLNAVKESILNGYAARCGAKCTRQHLADLMTKETFLTAQKAVELGLADSILYEDDGSEPAQILNSAQLGVQNALSAAAQLPDFAELKARYDREMAEKEGKPEVHSDEPADDKPAENTDDWKAQAALDIELNRFI